MVQKNEEMRWRLYLNFIIGKDLIKKINIKPVILARQHHHLRSTPAKSLQDSILDQWLNTVVHICNLSYVRKHKIGGHGQNWPQHIVRPYLKTASAKKGNRVAQVIEHLPSKCKALSSTPSTAPQKEKLLILAT
jgi:hypothetical protein